MKKLTLFVIAAIITTIAGAQIQFGAKAGLNLGNISVSPKPSGVSYSMHPSFHIGGLAYIPLFMNFALQPELMYSGQGVKLSYQGNSSVSNLGYINIPVLFKYKDPSGFFAEIGPQFGVLLSAKEKSGGSTNNFKDQLNTADVSGVLGIGYLSSLNIGADLRYNLGLTNIEKDASDGTAKNNVIQIGVFYLFGGSK
jgi:hypothetical protein